MKKEIKPEVLCGSCLGCGRLEDMEFEGVYRCKNYIKGRRDYEEESIKRA